MVVAVADTARRTLTVDVALQRFVDDELLPGLDIDPAVFWSGFADLVERFTPANRALLERRRLGQSLQGAHELVELLGGFG